MKAKFHIPDIWVHKDLNLYLIDMIKNHPEATVTDLPGIYSLLPATAAFRLRSGTVGAPLAAWRLRRRFKAR